MRKTINSFLAHRRHLVCCPPCFLQLRAQCASLLLGSLKVALQARRIYCFPLQLLHLHHEDMYTLTFDTGYTATPGLQCVLWQHASEGTDEAALCMAST